MNLTPRLASVATVALFSLPLGAAAQSIEPFAKTITILVAGTAGGGVDLYGRWVGRHIGRHIPGNPSVIVQVMPGAGGIRAANYLAEKAARDGSVLGTFPGGPLLEPLIGTRNPNYNMSEFNWIGAVSRDVSVCVAWGASPFKNINDVKTREMVVAGTGAGSETDTFPVMLNNLLETKFKVVTGYVGSKETFMAIEREEAHGRCGLTYSSLKASKPDWIRDKKINILLQMGLVRSDELPGTPFLSDLLSKPEDKQLVEMLLASTAIGRPLAAPPGTPAAHVEILRRAFEATMKDPQFLAEGLKMQAELSPTPGARVQEVVGRLYATPRPVVDRAKSLIGSKP